MTDPASEILRDWERKGIIDPNCPGCEPYYEAEDPRTVHVPHHKASKYCESGKRAHCTCDTCW